MRGIERQRDIGGVGQFEQAADFLGPLDRPPDVRVRREADAILRRPPPEFVECPGDCVQVRIGRTLRWPLTHVHLEVRAAENREEIPREGDMIVDRLLAGCRVDEIGRLPRPAIRAGRHRQAMLVEQRFQFLRSLHIGHNHPAIRLDAGEAERRDQRHILRLEIAEDGSTHREMWPVR